MEITLTKGRTSDRVAFRRDDGSADSFDFPKKGLTPHDAYHYFVERELGMARGFWGMVASGIEPAAIQQLAADAGHASAKRARSPDTSIVELLQAERLVECFEAESWSGGSDDEGIMAMAEPGWVASHVPAPSDVRNRIPTIRTQLRAFEERWKELALGESIELIWEE